MSKSIIGAILALGMTSPALAGTPITVSDIRGEVFSLLEAEHDQLALEVCQSAGGAISTSSKGCSFPSRALDQKGEFMPVRDVQIRIQEMDSQGADVSAMGVICREAGGRHHNKGVVEHAKGFVSSLIKEDSESAASPKGDALQRFLSDPKRQACRFDSGLTRAEAAKRFFKARQSIQ